jgi:hypothetical protein
MLPGRQRSAKPETLAFNAIFGASPMRYLAPHRGLVFVYVDSQTDRTLRLPVLSLFDHRRSG